MDSRTVLVVRPRRQARTWVDELAALGVPARALPLIDIEPAPDPARVREAYAAWRAARSPVAVFVSPNAVAGLFEVVRAGGHGGPAWPAWPADALACATGPGTVAALREAGVPAASIVAPPDEAGQFDSEALWQALGGRDWRARPVWIVRGNGGRDWLAERLREAGAEVNVVQAYARAAPALDEAGRHLLEQARAEPARWVWLFSSSEAIGHLEALAPGAHWGGARALASHPRIAERARTAGFRDVAVVGPSPRAVAQHLGARG